MHKSVNKPNLCPECGSSQIETTQLPATADWQCSACGELISRIRFVRPAPAAANQQRFFSKPDSCPECASVHLATIIYGIPDFETNCLWSGLERGEIVLAGNYTGEDYPLWQCLDCDAHLYSVMFP